MEQKPRWMEVRMAVLTSRSGCFLPSAPNPDSTADVHGWYTHKPWDHPGGWTTSS